MGRPRKRFAAIQHHFGQRNRRMFLVVAAFIAMAAIAVLLFLAVARRLPSQPNDSSGGARLDLPVPDDAPYFLQTDPKWANERLGGSGEFLDYAGCTVCSVAMAVNMLGVEVTPKELNSRLAATGGYTSRGWLVWNKVTEATQGGVTVRVLPRPTHRGLDDCLSSGGFPVVKFLLGGHVPHWVVVAGKSGREYLILDPLWQSKEVLRLSDRTEAIVSLRCVTRN